MRQGMYPNSFFRCVHLRFAVKSIKESGDAPKGKPNPKTKLKMGYKMGWKSKEEGHKTQGEKHV
jgi:hypothetical protein